MSHRGGPGGMFKENKKKSRDVSDKILWKWMLNYLKDSKRLFIGLILFLFLFTITSAFIPMLQQRMIDEGILAKEWQITLNYLLWIGVFTIVSTIGSGFINYQMGKIGTEVIYKVRAELFDNLQNISMDYYDKSHSGDIISITTNDVDQLNLVFGGQLAQTLSDGFRGILMMVLMLVMHWELALISFLLIPVFAVFMVVLRKKARKMFKKTRQAISEVTQKAEENISGMKVIQAYGKQEAAEKEFDTANRKNQQALLNTRKIFAFYIPLISFIMSIFSSLIILYGGFGILNELTILGNPISFGTLSAMSQYLTQLFMPLMSIAMFQQFLQAALAAGERIYKLLKEQTEIPDPEHPLEFADIQGTIEFKNITFSHQNENQRPTL
ncbi:ABC transporter ATP-binding protein, partial [Candidatus Pacearchaeota archaeon]|nr:ABC transporter ATP-binding protein [Candidatus Pacearchaeota archaeon]